MKTAQEVFDTVVNHLRAQGGRAIDLESSECKYRGPNGTKCAAGILIPDDRYSPSFEGKKIQYLVDALDPDVLAHMELIAVLQCIHDEDERWERHEGEWENLASRFGLVYTPPAEA